MLMVQALLCRYVSLYSPPASLESQRTQRIIIFPLPLRGRQWKSTKQLMLRKRQKASILCLQGANTVILLPEGLSRFAFRRLSEKQKNKKLCDLCDSAVNNLLLKTLLESPYATPLRVVIDYWLITLAFLRFSLAII